MILGWAGAVPQDGYWNFKETSIVQMATEGSEMTALNPNHVLYITVIYW